MLRVTEIEVLSVIADLQVNKRIVLVYPLGKYKDIGFPPAEV